MRDEQERIALFIDGANLYATSKGLKIDIDYKKFLEIFKARGYLVSARYYTAIVENPEEHTSVRPLIDWLAYNGYVVIQKYAKEYDDNITGLRKIKGNMDVEIAIDAYRMSSRVDHIYLFSGDGDFVSLVRAVQEQGTKVTVVSSRMTIPSLISNDLRMQADEFFELGDIRSEIERRRDAPRLPFQL